MKIKISEPGYPDIQPLEIDLGCREVALREVYNGIGIETDQGRFGIAERDGGIEVMLNGELIWSSTEYIGTGASETVRQSIYHDVDKYRTTDAVLEEDNQSPSCSLCGHKMGTAARPIGGIEETTGQPICEQCRMQVDGDPDDAGDDRNSLAREARKMCLRYWRKDD